MEIQNFTPVGKPWKRLPWQITKGIDKWGNPTIQIKYYKRREKGGFDFSKKPWANQCIFAKPADWKELIRSIRKK